VTEAVREDEQLRKGFQSVFVALAGLVLAEMADPAAAQAILAAIAGG
jgi:hypothetical protein